MLKKIAYYFVLAAIFFLAIALPIFKFDFDVSIVLTSVALFFTILIGFFIAAATSNYLRLQTLIANEDATLISIYRMVKLIQPSAEKKLKELTDKYMIAVLDYDTLGYASGTMKEFNALVEAVDKIVLTNKSMSGILENLHNAKDNLIAIRQEAIISFKKIVTFQHWFILTTLALIIATLLLALRSGDLSSSIIVGLMLVALFQTLSLLYKIDSNSFLADRLAYENSQYVFSAIGKAKYYPEHAMTKKLRRSLSQETYRLGTYIDFPNTMEKEITPIRPLKNSETRRKVRKSIVSNSKGK